LTGYEIHMGQVVRRAGVNAAFSLRTRNGQSCELGDGAVDASGRVVGTLLHGVLENDGVRASLLAAAWERRGLTRADTTTPVASVEAEYDRLEANVREHLDLDLLRQLARVG
jgi:adenosylcobyric acid synthase